MQIGFARTQLLDDQESAGFSGSEGHFIDLTKRGLLAQFAQMLCTYEPSVHKCHRLLFKGIRETNLRGHEKKNFQGVRTRIFDPILNASQVSIS